MQIDLDAAALGKSVDEPSDRGIQPGFIEERRVEEMRDCARFSDRIIRQFQAILNNRFPGTLRSSMEMPILMAARCWPTES